MTDTKWLGMLRGILLEAVKMVSGAYPIHAPPVRFGENYGAKPHLRSNFMAK